MIVLGADEPEPGVFNIVGIKKPDKVLDDFWNAALSEDKVSARFMKDSDATIETIDGKSIVVIRVPWAERHIRPIFINGDIFGGTFRRMHTGDHQCKREEVLSMLRDSATQSQDAEVAKNARMEYLNHDTIMKYRRRFDSFNEGHVWSSFGETEFLEAIGAAALDEDGELRPTCAGLLMFSEHRFIIREFPHYLLDYRQETGRNERWEDRTVSFTGDWTGNVFDFYFRAYNKMKAALKVPFQMKGIDRIDDTPAHKAMREALANCLTNANWYERRGVVCVWREGDIEIANPGDFRMPIAEAMKPGSSDPRNEVLLSMFAMIDVGERAGSGMDKIMRGWKSAGYAEPCYEVEYGPDRTTLTLPLLEVSAEESDDHRQIESSDYQNDKNAARTGRTEENKQAITRYLTINGPSKSSDISAAIGLKTTRTNQILREMVAEGTVRPEGQARNRVYVGVN